MKFHFGPDSATGRSLETLFYSKTKTWIGILHTSGVRTLHNKTEFTENSDQRESLSAQQ